LLCRVDTIKHQRLMQNCEEVGYHEAGHAIGAIKLAIGLESKGIQRQSPCDGTTYVQESIEGGSEEWYIRRAAVKLSGPAAECRYRNQIFNRDILASEPHYFGDYREAERILQFYQSQQGFINPIRLEQQLLQALRLAEEVVSTNWDVIKRVAQASEREPHLTADKILALVRTAGSSSV
jgi:hypothetical protein